jgi:hypothetical protein
VLLDHIDLAAGVRAFPAYDHPHPNMLSPATFVDQGGG